MNPVNPANHPRRRVVVVLKGYPRLSETFIAQELRGLELAGFDLALVALRQPTDAKRHPVHAEITAPVTYLPEYLHQAPWRVLRGFGHAIRRPGFWPALAAFAKDLRRDPTRNRIRRFGQAMVLVAEWPKDGAWLHAHFIHTPASVAAYASLITGIPFTVSAHAKDIWTSPDWDLAAKLARARWAVTCTRFGYDHLRALSAKPETVHLSYHGLNLARFPAPRLPRPPRDGTNPADPAIILSVGRAVPNKGYDILLHALALLPPDLHWRFQHMGDGGERAILKTLAQTLGLADKIQWLGAVDQTEVLTRYRAADLFALACRITPDGDRDGLPNVLVEAASQGLACVATDISGIPELFTDGKNGLLTPPDDAKAFARALESAIRNPALRARLGANAQTKTRATLDFHTSIAELAALFDHEWGSTL